MAYHADNALPSHSEGERVLPMQKGGKQRLKKSDIWVTGSFDVPFFGAVFAAAHHRACDAFFPPPMPMLFIMMMATAMLISAAS